MCSIPCNDEAQNVFSVFVCVLSHRLRYRLRRKIWFRPLRLINAPRRFPAHSRYPRGGPKVTLWPRGPGNATPRFRPQSDRGPAFRGSALFITCFTKLFC